MPSRNQVRTTVRTPKGAEWARFKSEPRCYYLLYHGIRWGWVYLPLARQNLVRNRTNAKWFSENVLGQINWGKTREEAMRLLTRTLKTELEITKTRLDD